VGAAALHATVGSWLAVRLQAGTQRQDRRRAVAVNGKAVRGTCNASSDGQAVHLLAALDQQAGAVLARAAVDGKTNEITQFAPLLAPLALAGRVVTADALHTQREHAEFLVPKKNAHYIMVVKKNQPTLHTQIKNLPGSRPRPPSASTIAGMAAGSAGPCRPRPSPPGRPSRHAVQAIRLTRRIRAPDRQDNWRTVTVYAITSISALFRLAGHTSIAARLPPPRSRRHQDPGHSRHQPP
jgi:hypothetical protein